MDRPEDYLPHTLRTLRTEKGLSLDKASQLTGVSKAMLGQIERGESSPTVSTLWKIATGLDESLSTFIEASPQPDRSTVIRTSDDIRQHPAEGGLHIAPLFPYESNLGFEYLELIFATGYEKQSEPHAHGVIEFITVLEGQLDVFCDNVWHTLNVGQTIRFAGDRPHGYRNLTETDCKVMTVIHYPNNR